MSTRVYHYHNDVLCCEAVDLNALAEEHGTPLYVYSREAIEAAFLDYQRALGDQPHLICYAVKANSNLAVLDCLARLGAGFDIVSGGELERVLAAGGDPSKVVFSGVCKKPSEMARALQVGIRCFNVESEAELETLAAVAAEHNCVAPVSLRVNPDVDALTHPYISTGLKENKFGVDINIAANLYERAAALPSINPVGIDCHIGSQLLDIEPFSNALARLLRLIDDLERRGISIKHLDLGGGLGVQYANESVPSVADYIHTLKTQLSERRFELMFEPGRSIVAMAGVLLTRVNYLKPTAHKNFALIDAAMNDLLRPALYSAWQDIIPIKRRSTQTRQWDIVGPVCETGDFLGKDRELALEAGDLLAVTGAGAYGFVMASNYNSRTRPAEIMIDGDQAYVIRERETLAQLWQGEHRLPTRAQS